MPDKPQYYESFESWEDFPVGKWRRCNSKECIVLLCKYEESRQLAISSNVSRAGSTAVLDIAVKELEGRETHFNIENFWAFINGRFDETIKNSTIGRKEDLISIMRKYKNIFYKINEPLIRLSIAEAYDLAFK